MGSVNKQFGFYGTVNNEFDDETTERIWNLMMTKLKEMYPNKSEDELVEFLDSRTGRHFADDLLSDPQGITMGVLMLKIAMLTINAPSYLPVAAPSTSHVETCGLLPVMV